MEGGVTSRSLWGRKLHDVPARRLNYQWSRSRALRRGELVKNVKKIEATVALSTPVLAAANVVIISVVAISLPVVVVPTAVLPTIRVLLEAFDFLLKATMRLKRLLCLFALGDENLVQLAPVEPHALTGRTDIYLHAFTNNLLHLRIVIWTKEKRHECLLCF